MLLDYHGYDFSYETEQRLKRERERRSHIIRLIAWTTLGGAAVWLMALGLNLLVLAILSARGWLG